MPVSVQCTDLWLCTSCQPRCTVWSPIHFSVLTYLLQGAKYFLRSGPVLSYSRNSTHLIEPESSLPHSQVPAMFPLQTHIDPVHASTSNLLKIHPIHASPSHFLNIHFNIILRYTPWSSKWPLSLRFPLHNPVYSSPILHTRYMPHPSHSSPFYHPHNIGWAVQIIKLLIM